MPHDAQFGKQVAGGGGGGLGGGGEGEGGGGEGEGGGGDGESGNIRGPQSRKVCRKFFHTALRAPPWAFTQHRVCSHHPRNVSAHALSSPRGIGILAPAPRCDQRAGGRRTRRIPPLRPHTHTSTPTGYRRGTAPKPAVVLLTSTSTQYNHRTASLPVVLPQNNHLSRCRSG